MPMATTPVSNNNRIASPRTPLRQAPRVQTHLATVDAVADTGAADEATGIVHTWPPLRSNVGLTQSAFVRHSTPSSVPLPPPFSSLLLSFPPLVWHH